MYKEHVPLIRDYALNNGNSGLDNLFYFVLGSIRTQFLQLPAITYSIIKEGAGSRHIWGNKITAYTDWQNQDRSSLLKDIESASTCTVELSQRLAGIRGIGITKASFVLQLLGRDTACLDVHNLKELGLNYKTFKNPKKAQEYYETVNKQGSEYFWDSWCELIANKNPKHFSDANEVSKAHLDIINGTVTETFKKKELTQ